MVGKFIGQRIETIVVDFKFQFLRLCQVC